MLTQPSPFWDPGILGALVGVRAALAPAVRQAYTITATLTS